MDWGQEGQPAAALTPYAGTWCDAGYRGGRATEAWTVVGTGAWQQTGPGALPWTEVWTRRHRAQHGTAAAAPRGGTEADTPGQLESEAAAPVDLADADQPGPVSQGADLLLWNAAIWLYPSCTEYPPVQMNHCWIWEPSWIY